MGLGGNKGTKGELGEDNGTRPRGNNKTKDGLVDINGTCQDMII